MCVGVASVTVMLLGLLLVLMLVLSLVLVLVLMLMLVMLLVLLPELLVTMLTTRTTAMLAGRRLGGARRGRAQRGRRSRRRSGGGDGRWRLCMRRRWGRRGGRCPLTPSSACFGARRWSAQVSTARFWRLLRALSLRRCSVSIRRRLRAMMCRGWLSCFERRQGPVLLPSPSRSCARELRSSSTSTSFGAT